jgi:hypothetical protein
MNAHKNDSFGKPIIAANTFQPIYSGNAKKLDIKKF